MFGKLNRGIVIRNLLWLVFVSFAIIVIIYLIHDVKLKEEILKLSNIDTPEIRLENIKFEREMFGSLLKINIPSLERQKNIVKLLSVDVTRVFQNGETWKIKGDSGEYIESYEIARLNRVSGHVVLDGYFFELCASVISWEKSGDLVILSEGVNVNGSFASLSADKVEVKDANIATIERGEIVWNFTSYDLR